MNKKNLLAQIDALTGEIEDVSAVIEKMETFRTFNKYLTERHVDSNIVCEINRYQDLLSIDVEGTIIKADALLQIRYNDRKAKSNKQSN